MPKYKVEVFIHPRRAFRAPDTAFNRMMGIVGEMQGEILDPQGEAVCKILPGLGFTNVTKVRIGKQYSLTITARNKKAVRKMVESMCNQLLCGLTEDYKIVSVSRV